MDGRTDTWTDEHTDGHAKFLVGNPWTFGTESPDDTGEQSFVHLFNYCFVTDYIRPVCRHMYN